MSLFLIRSTLRRGWRVGLAIGAGIAIVDALYAAAGAVGRGSAADDRAAAADPRPRRRGGADRARHPHAAQRVPRAPGAGGAVRGRRPAPSPSSPRSRRPRRTRPRSRSWAAIFAAASVAGATDSSGGAVRAGRGRGARQPRLGDACWPRSSRWRAAPPASARCAVADVIAGAGADRLRLRARLRQPARRVAPAQPRRKRATAACLVASSTVRPAPPSGSVTPPDGLSTRCLPAPPVSDAPTTPSSVGPGHVGAHRLRRRPRDPRQADERLERRDLVLHRRDELLLAPRARRGRSRSGCRGSCACARARAPACR